MRTSWDSIADCFRNQANEDDLAEVRWSPWSEQGTIHEEHEEVMVVEGKSDVVPNLRLWSGRSHFLVLELRDCSPRGPREAG